MRSSSAQQVGTCSPGQAAAFLEANDARAIVYNTGSLFGRDEENVYVVPKEGNASVFYDAGVWIGGLVDGDLRFAGSESGPLEFYPGPLTSSGGLPDASDCSAYDRIFEVSSHDVQRLDASGVPTADIRDWPWQYGAPVEDGDGIADNYNLAAGDRPEISGHQMLWWVMNDLGGPHEWGRTAPLGVEIHASAFSVVSAQAALDNATFYRYRILNKQSYAIDSVYVGFRANTDLGYGGDDYVGSDTLLQMAFSYNGDDFDDGPSGYGDRPPAVGVDVVQGPRAETDGEDNDRDGVIDENGERLGMSAFVRYNNDSTVQGRPTDAEDAYNYMNARWRDGSPVTLGGPGYGGTYPVRYMYPGDPVTSFWSEINPDLHVPSERRWILSTGPFRLDPGEIEEVVFAVVWAQGEDRLDSVAELRNADRAVQTAWDESNLRQVPIPPFPREQVALVSPAGGVSAQPGSLTIRWTHVDLASYYEVDLSQSPSFGETATYVARGNTVAVDSLKPFADYYWRVRPQSAITDLPASEARHFRTSDAVFSEIGVQMIPGTNMPAFLEIVGPGGSDPCSSESKSTGGCAEAGGNNVYGSLNSTGEYVMHYHPFPRDTSAEDRPETTLGVYFPNEYDIRFTQEGSYAIYAFWDETAVWVPFEIWDVGSAELFDTNDVSDDVQMIPILYSDVGARCEFGYGEEEDPSRPGFQMSQRIYAYYPATTYADWNDAVQPLIDADPNRCRGADSFLDFVDIDRGRPLQRITFSGDPAFQSHPGYGTVVRFYTTSPVETPPAPAAPAPGSGPLTQPVDLSWNGPDWTYQLQIASDRAFRNVALDVTTRAQPYPVSGLVQGDTYYWRVRLTGQSGPWSDSWSFVAGEITNVRSQRDDELPRELTLRQNYPNPFNPSTTIRYALPEAGRVQVVVYDLLGRIVETIVDRSMPAGWHDVTWNASGYASGVYIYSVQTTSRRLSKSLVLAK